MSKSQFVEHVCRNKELRPNVIQSFHPELRSSAQVVAKIIKLFPWWLRKYEDIQDKVGLITLAWYWMEQEEGRKLDEAEFYGKFMKAIAVRMHNTWLAKVSSEEYKKLLDDGKEDSQ